jgi:hypothetical protein
MDYFQGVVAEYLRANRSTFINTECMIQLDEGSVPAKGRHWFCDIIAVNLVEKRVYLCEVTFSKTLGALTKRLQTWSANWPAIKAALVRDCGVNQDWAVTPWLFIPRALRPVLDARLAQLKGVGAGDPSMPTPKVNHLEEVVPWEYQHWDRKLAAIEAMHDKAAEAKVP